MAASLLDPSTGSESQSQACLISRSISFFALREIAGVHAISRTQKQKPLDVHRALVEREIAIHCQCQRQRQRQRQRQPVPKLASMSEEINGSADIAKGNVSLQTTIYQLGFEMVKMEIEMDPAQGLHLAHHS